MKFLLSLVLLLASPLAGAAQEGGQPPTLSPGPELQAYVVNDRYPQSPRSADVLVFDSFTGAGNYTTTTGSPRTYMGMPIAVSAAGGANPTISKVTVYMSYLGASLATFNSLRVNLQLWDSWSSGAAPVFSNAPASVIVADVTGPFTLNPGTYTTIDVTLATPVPLTGLGSHGIAVNFQGDTGAGLVSSDNFTALLRTGNALAVGTNLMGSGLFGYRNASNRTDLNFLPGDARGFQGATDQATVFKLYSSTSALANQVITNFVATPAHPVRTSGSFTVSATGGASGNPVRFSIDPSGAAICTPGGTNGATLSIHGVGVCTVLADQAGNASYNPAPQQSIAVTIGNGTQTITNFVATPANPVFSNPPFTVSATGGASGNPVTFSIDPASAAICSSGGANGATITMLAPGTCTVRANQAGDGIYTAAPQKSLAVLIANPTALVQDGGFEAGFVSTYWAQTSTNFGTPLCDEACGGAGSRTGAYWAWFGGANTTEEAASLEQTGIITPGPKALNFYLWWVSPVTSPPDPAATFTVKMDGTPIFNLTPATAAAYHGNYTLATVDISAYADGNPHTLRFESHSAASNGPTNIDVDDISIVVGTSNDRIFANGFE